MKNYKTKFFIFITSLVIGYLVVINSGIGKQVRIFNLNTIQYRDAANERSKLYDEISNLKEDNYNISKKIQSYNVDENGNEKVIEHMKEQLEDYKIISGYEEVKGPGIILTISDGKYDIYNDSDFEVNRRTLHSSDAALVLNELRVAGAEAIAINNYRIINTTGVDCAWAFIRFDDKEVMEAAPFKFYAIGDPDKLEEAILTEGSHVNKLIIRNLNVEIEKDNEITLNRTINSMQPKYMERADN